MARDVCLAAAQRATAAAPPTRQAALDRAAEKHAAAGGDPDVPPPPPDPEEMVQEAVDARDAALGRAAELARQVVASVVPEPPRDTWHPAGAGLDALLPPLPEIFATRDPRAGGVRVENGPKHNSFRAAMGGPTDASSWRVAPRAPSSSPNAGGSCDASLNSICCRGVAVATPESITRLTRHHNTVVGHRSRPRTRSRSIDRSRRRCIPGLVLTGSYPSGLAKRKGTQPPEDRRGAGAQIMLAGVGTFVCLMTDDEVQPCRRVEGRIDHHLAMAWRVV